MQPVTEVLTRLNLWMRRYWVHSLNNQRIRGIAKYIAEHEPEARTAPVVFFNATTRLSGLSLNAAFALLAGWALRLSGTPVVNFVCQAGLSRCILGARHGRDGRPPCGECMAQSQFNFAYSQTHSFTFQADPALKAKIEHWGVGELLELEYEGVPLGKLVRPSIRWMLRRFHLQDDEATRFLLREYILSAWRVTQEFSRLLDQVKPQTVVVFNGLTYPEAAARWVACQRGLEVITHEVCLQPYSAFFTRDEATIRTIEVPPEFDLSEAQSVKLDAYLEKRFQGQFKMAGVQFWTEMHSLGDAFWQRASAFRQVVPVFPNVIFDTSQEHANIVFPHMFAWLDQILEMIRAHPETYFVIRAHPDEERPGKESRESVMDWAKKNQLEKLPNVFLVEPRQYFSSYELIRKCKFVMMYNSTIGLEAALMGAAVLCGGRSRFTHLPMVFFPQTMEAHRKQAEEFLAVEKIDVPSEFLRNARRYLYFELFRAALPFEQYLQEDGVWKGYVTLRDFDWKELLPENSPVLGAIVNGILHHKPFWVSE